MNQINMPGMPATNGLAPQMGMMNNVPNGVPIRAVDEQDSASYKSRLNTAIYDYLLKNGEWGCARELLKSKLEVQVIKSSPGRRPNGVDENTMDTDVKDDPDSQRPSDLPLPRETGAAMGSDSSFLLDWYSVFWDMFLSKTPRAMNKNQNAVQYVQHTQAGILRLTSYIMLIKGVTEPKTEPSAIKPATTTGITRTTTRRGAKQRWRALYDARSKRNAYEC